MLNDTQVLQAALLALTMQNVTGERGSCCYAVYGRAVVTSEGRVEELGPVCGDFESA